MTQLLVSHLDDLVVSMSEGLGSESRPQLRSVQLLRHFDRDIQIPAFNGKFEPCLRILNELQRNFRIAFLL